jgi:hypothetical protein
LAEKALVLLPGRPIEEEHMEDVLGPERPPRMPTNLARRCAEQQEGSKKE